MSTSSAEVPVLLAIETSTLQGSVAVSRGGEVLCERPIPGARQGPSLLGEIEALLGQAGLGLRSLAAIACGVGPGNFTGLRVGLATAKGLCYGLDLPLCPVPSLEALAARALDLLGAEVVAPVLDARRGEVYGAAFSRALARQLPECTRTPEAMGAALRELPAEVVACGGGAILFRERLGVRVAEDEALSTPRAADVARLAARGWPGGGLRGQEAWALAPLYIRPSDAEIHARERG